MRNSENTSKVVTMLSFIPLAIAVIPIALVTFYFETPFEVINKAWCKCNEFLTRDIFTLFIVVAVGMVLFIILHALSHIYEGKVYEERNKEDETEFSKKTSSIEREIAKYENSAVTEEDKTEWNRRLANHNKKSTQLLNSLSSHYDNCQEKLIEQYGKSIQVTADLSEVCCAIGDGNYKYFEFQKKEVSDILKEYESPEKNRL